MKVFSRKEMIDDLLKFEEGYFSSYPEKEIHETFVWFCENSSFPEKKEDWNGNDFKFDLELYLEVVADYLNSLETVDIEIQHKDHCEFRYE